MADEKFTWKSLTPVLSFFGRFIVVFLGVMAGSYAVKMIADLGVF
jgi:hypothetical protein